MKDSPTAKQDARYSDSERVEIAEQLIAGLKSFVQHHPNCQTRSWTMLFSRGVCTCGADEALRARIPYWRD